MIFRTRSRLCFWGLLAAQVTCGSSAGLARVRVLPLGLPPFRADSGFTRENVDFGQFLFESTLLSRDRTISCRSCHLPERAYADTGRVSTGVFGRRGLRNAPTLTNLYAREAWMWEGRAVPARQPLLPLESHREMDVDWPDALRALNRREETRAWLRVRGTASLTREDVVACLSAFVRTLVSGGSRLDRHLYRGDHAALDARERRGLRLFTGKARCVRCHAIGPGFAPLADEAYHVLGVGFLPGGWNDAGRGSVTGLRADSGSFRTPSLRNVSRTAPYMHDGSLSNLTQVVRFYDFGGERGLASLDTAIVPLDLTEGEIADLVAFLESLVSPVVQYYPWSAW